MPALGRNGYIMCLEQNRHLLSELTKFGGVPSPAVTLLFGGPIGQSNCKKPNVVTRLVTNTKVSN